ncbi:hypothetical protein OPV22_004036 [Ensete ventricosum]|uniref:Uncharacterized protein n=1 Tax=Ensete ventricosum TaxID=4639 RepID=A0AAV8S298_ENSVE|nr:hypothetical protein OPV22_004036 [Ensete ventricosum]
MGSSLSGICLPVMSLISFGGGGGGGGFLSIVYDHVLNPGHWTEDMRDEALEPADLHDPGLKSPHQLAKAKQKEELKECTIIEELPFPTDSVDRYISAGREAYRVLKLGGKNWMFKKAGFKDIKLKRIGPKWYRGVCRHGLIMGCSVTGVQREFGDSPFQLGPEAEDVEKPVNPFSFLVRFILAVNL